MEDNKRLMQKIERLSEDNEHLRRQVGDLEEVVKLLWEAEVEEKKCTTELVQAMENYALDVNEEKENSVKTGKDAGTLAEKTDEVVGNTATDQTATLSGAEREWLEWMKPASREGSDDGANEDDLDEETEKELWKVERLQERCEQATAEEGAVVTSPGVVIKQKGDAVKTEGRGYGKTLVKQAAPGLEAMFVRPAQPEPGSFEAIENGRKKRKGKGKGKSAQAQAGFIPRRKR